MLNTFKPSYAMQHIVALRLTVKRFAQIFSFIQKQTTAINK